MPSQAYLQDSILNYGVKIMATVTSNTIKIIRLATVKEITGISRSAIYSEMAKHRFPQSVRITEKSVGWLLSDIQAFIESKIAQSRNLTKEGV